VNQVIYLFQKITTLFIPVNENGAQSKVSSFGFDAATGKLDFL
jgi:hypothetical protein